MADKDIKKKSKKEDEQKDTSSTKKEELPVTNTKTIPVIITLSAALIACVMSILGHVEFKVYVERLIFAVVVFGIIGIVVRVILDRYFFRPKDEKEALQEHEAEDELDKAEGEEEGTEES